MAIFLLRGRGMQVGYEIIAIFEQHFALSRKRYSNNNNNNNNQYIYKQRQSHALSQRRWLATAVIFRPSDVSLGFAGT